MFKKGDLVEHKYWGTVGTVVNAPIYNRANGKQLISVLWYLKGYSKSYAHNLKKLKSKKTKSNKVYKAGDLF